MEIPQVMFFVLDCARFALFAKLATGVALPQEDRWMP
jgi:hypothetical protein